MIKILDAEQTSLAEILARTEDQRDISGIVSRIIEDVRQSGDEALRRYTKEFDHTEIIAFEVPQSQIETAYETLDPVLRAVLEEAAENIRAFHQR